MATRALLFTPGSPFARAVRVVLDELDLNYERREAIATSSVSERASATPTLQVPAFWDGGMRLWESVLIVEYLLTTYSAKDLNPVPLANSLFRPESMWTDRLVMSTIQTLGTAVTTVSQIKWDGIGMTDSDYLKRSVDRLPFILQWLEGEIPDDSDGFFPGQLSSQDIFLVCHLDFVENRPIGIDCNLTDFPKIQSLVERLRNRSSFARNPIYWWEPGVIGYKDGGIPIYG